jgi:hypothetical protein
MFHKNKTIVFIFITLLIVNFVNSIRNNGEKCSSNNDCLNHNCGKDSKCQPIQCRNDKVCIEHGLRDNYCRKRTRFIPSIFPSECVPKKGKFNLFII